jgi:HEPN domain-containing protein
MKPLTREWVKKAEGDFVTASREFKSRSSPNFDATCFHAQQCVEKYLKARLQESGIGFPKTHDLVALLNLTLNVEPTWLQFTRAFVLLKVHAIDVRYPGAFATKAGALRAITACRNFRKIARASLGIKGAKKSRRKRVKKP